MSDSNFPETDNPAFVSTDNPRTIRANADASRARFRVVELETPVIGERLQAVWTRKFGNQGIRVDVQFYTLHPRGEI